MTLTRLTILDWLLGSVPETEADRVTEQEAERLRRAFPDLYSRSAAPLGSRLLFQLRAGRTAHEPGA
jgi:hypothetical protein